MRSHSQLMCLAIAALLSLPACTAPASAVGVAVPFEIEVIENTLDGCTACSCSALGELRPEKPASWWMTIGRVKANSLGGWEADSASSRCGSGPFAEISSDYLLTIGSPYVIVDMTTIAELPAAGVVRLKTEATTRRFSGFDDAGRPLYGHNTATRTILFRAGDERALPLLIPTPMEKESYGFHEVVLRMRADIMGREAPVSYGALEVTTDIPGAEILLDSGFVGRTSWGKPVLIENVVAGAREILVRDYSGREARKTAFVAGGRKSAVTLSVLNHSPTGTGRTLVPLSRNPQGYEEFLRSRDGALIVRIPAGEFLMGSLEGKGEADERPRHQVKLREFLIDKTEVTWRQFSFFADATSRPLPPPPISGATDDYPVSNLMWDEAQAYCEWVGGRLPTEAEWEKAARGTDGREYPWGDAWDSRRCNSISGGLHRPESVGSYPDCISPYGVLDTVGSMWEWCADWYGAGYYEESPQTDPWGPAAGTLRVLRGGAWMTQAIWARSAYRRKLPPASRNVDHGFRCAHDGPE